MIPGYATPCLRNLETGRRRGRVPIPSAKVDGLDYRWITATHIDGIQIGSVVWDVPIYVFGEPCKGRSF